MTGMITMMTIYTNMETLLSQALCALCGVCTQNSQGQGAANTRHCVLSAGSAPRTVLANSKSKFWTDEFMCEFVNSLFCPMPSPDMILLQHMQEGGMEKSGNCPKDYSCKVARLSQELLSVSLRECTSLEIKSISLHASIISKTTAYV